MFPKQVGVPLKNAHHASHNLVTQGASLDAGAFSMMTVSGEPGGMMPSEGTIHSEGDAFELAVGGKRHAMLRKDRLS
jgi:hypothetical protein